MNCCRYLLVFLIVALFFIFRPLPVQAQSAPAQLWYIYFNDQADLNQLAAELDVWEVDHPNNRLLALLSADEATLLSRTRQLVLSPDQSPLAPRVGHSAQVDGIPGYECYRTVEENIAAYDQLAVAYPNLVTIQRIGNSWDKANAGGPAGDDLRVLVISNKAMPGPKFRFFLMGAIHAREYTTAELALRFAESLLNGYGRDANATWLLDHGELHLLAIANPDGRRIAENGMLWRKNTHFDSCTVSLPFRSYGIDLNRNSSFHWNQCDGSSCSSANSCAETYRGAAPASEPEVEAIEEYLRSIFPDQRGQELEDSASFTTQGLFLSLHSYGRLVLFPWGWTTTHAPNGLGLATLARRMGYPLNYRVCQAGGAGCLYQTDGSTDDFSYGELGIASFTIELGTTFFQTCSTFEDTMLDPGLAALRYAFSAAPRPYILPEGPEVLNLTATPREIGVATHVAISATADASRLAFLSGDGVSSISEPIEPIGGARLTVDQLPWEDTPYAYPLSASDGAFNTIQEGVTTTVEVACLPSGRHKLYVQALDSAGDWGVVTAEFVTVTNSSPFTASVQLAEQTIRPGEALSYTIQVTNTGATTNTFTVESIGAPTSTITPSQPYTLPAGASLQITTVITPEMYNADTKVPTLFVIRSTTNPAHCRQLQVTTSFKVWNNVQRLLFIAKR